MSTLATFRTLVNDKVKDVANKLGTFASDSTIYDSDIQEAVKKYSQKIHDNDIYSHAVVSGETYDFDLPSDWEEDFSTIINIEYPISQFPPEYIDSKCYKVERTVDGLQLRFVDYPYPTVGETFYLRYTRRHSVTASASTIPVAHEESVANLAASFVCKRLASYYTTTTESSLSADVINYQTKRAEYISQSNAFQKLFDDSIKDDTTGVVSEWDASIAYGVDPLTHDRDLF